MPGQKQISAFFKPLATATPKRQLSSEDADNPVKKAKCVTMSENGLVFCANDIEKKRLMAKIKLQSRATPIVPADIGLSWFAALEPEFSKDYFVKLSSFVQDERRRYTVYPSHENVFTWTKSCEVNKVKVIILGQDPYHNPGQAHGLAFSVPKGVATPMSLLNMYKELAADIPGFLQPSHGNLTGWAEQGVLLLNACLTVRMNQPNSHKDKGWENLTDAVIRHLNKQCSSLVFLLWGAYAQKKGSIIDRKKHLVLQCAHPSPLSASRGFFGCRHFSKANEYLTKHCREPIDWSLLP
uniref:Uracil-DNA glycosylase n=1 Tax=Amblyomma aureolatum TaxID=187763 RepID=A0A1E1XE03_9ACAR